MAWLPHSPEELRQVARALEKAAETEILPRYRNLSRADVREKAPGDVVTAADEAMEMRLVALLTELAPDASIVAEESVSRDQAKVSPLAGVEPLWVIDPLDGTRTFAAGQPGFGVLVAYRGSDGAYTGWMHDPVRRRMAFGGPPGAWLCVDDEESALALADATPPEAGIVLDDLDTNELTETARVRAREEGFELFAPELAGISPVFQLLQGQLRFVVCSAMKPWDYLPTAAVVEAAGGHAAPLDGTEWRLSGATETLLFARSHGDWRRLRDLLAPR